MNGTARIAIVCTVWFLSQHAISARTDDARALMESLPRRTQAGLIIVEGALEYVEGVNSWQLLVNDAVVLKSAAVMKAPLKLRVAVSLRTGDNLIRLESLQSAGSAPPVVLREWTTHIYRVPDRPAERFALLIQGDSAPGSHSADLVSAVKARLLQLGLRPDSIFLATTFDDTNKALDSISHSTQRADRLFLYYAGVVRSIGPNGEPALVYKANAEVAFPLTDLVRVAGEFSGASIVVDAAFIDESKDAKELPVAKNSDRMGIPWLQALRWPAHVELALSHKAPSPGSTEAGDLTQAILSTPFLPDGRDCETLSDVTFRFAKSEPSIPAAAPLYFRGDPSFTSSCLDSVPILPIIVDVKLSEIRDVEAIDVSTQVPPRREVNWVDLLVDGIVLRHQAVTANTNGAIERVAISEGTHLITVRAGSGTNVLAEGSTEFTLPNRNGSSTRLASRTLHSHLQNPTGDLDTTNPSVSVVFTIGNSKGEPFYYQLRNEGVVVRRGVAVGSRHRLELVRTVPLNFGSNSIVVEVSDRQGGFAESRINFIRRPSQPVRAVLIGTDSPYALKDAELMERTLLNFSDASLSDITVLSGRGATRAAIEQAVLNHSFPRPVDPAAGGISGPETFFLYYAGYGLTVGNKTRCILPGDFDPQRPEETCISTSQLDSLLDAHDRSIVVFDTSYDGAAQVGATGPEALRLGPGRTYREFVSDDVNWRASAGVDRADRLFLVAGETNSPALTSGELQHGLFTSSLSEAIAERVAPKDGTGGEMPIYDAFAAARNMTLARSGGRQRPIVKGVLISPFAFSERSPAHLKREGDAIIERTVHDARAMRALNSAELNRAKALYEKILFFQPSDADAMQGLAAANLYLGNLPAATELIANGVQRPGIDATTRSNWLLLSAKVKTRAGDIKGARADAAKAFETQPRSTDIRIELAYLHAASGDYERCREVLQTLGRDLLNKGHEVQAGDLVDAGIADDNWGRAVLIMYVAFRRTGHPRSAFLALESYAEAYRDKALLKRLLDNRLFRKLLLTRQSYAIAVGSQSVEEPWSHLVAEYFQHPAKYAEELSSFRSRTQALDPKDEAAFECLLHYYKGMQALLDGNRVQARAEFAAIEATPRTEYVEYWIAQSELKSLKASASISEPRRSQ